MSGHTKIILKNRLRDHHKPNFINTIRKLINVRKGSSVGSDVIIDKNVEILRFPRNVSIGNEVILKEGVKICPANAKARISIGDRTTVGYHTMLFASKNIVVGNDCMIAPFAYIVDSNHLTKKDIPRLPRHPLQPEDCTAHKQAYIDFIQSSINYDFHLSPI